MTAFNLAALKPATAIEGLGKPAAQSPKTAKQAAVANIDAQLALLDPKVDGKRTFWDRVVDGKRSYTGEGTHVGFYVKVGSTKLMLGGTQEAGVAKAKFEETLKGIRAAIDSGQLDEQLAVLDGAKSARTSKLRTTRQAKKGAKPAEEKKAG